MNLFHLQGVGVAPTEDKCPYVFLFIFGGSAAEAVALINSLGGVLSILCSFFRSFFLSYFLSY